MGLLDRLAPRKPDVDPRVYSPPPADSDPVFATKALRKFLLSLTARNQPVILDLGPVVGSNVNFLGERLGCKIFVEDLFADLDRHERGGAMGSFPAFLEKRFTQENTSVDGILCWDLIDHLDRRSAQALATALVRLLAPDGVLLAFFGTTQSREPVYTKFVIVDDLNLKHRAYPASRAPHPILPNREILRLFADLRVSDSFLLQNNRREILFRKPV